MHRTMAQGMSFPADVIQPFQESKPLAVLGHERSPTLWTTYCWMQHAG